MNSNESKKITRVRVGTSKIVHAARVTRSGSVYTECGAGHITTGLRRNSRLVAVANSEPVTCKRCLTSLAAMARKASDKESAPAPADQESAPAPADQTGRFSVGDVVTFNDGPAVLPRIESGEIIGFESAESFRTLRGGYAKRIAVPCARVSGEYAPGLPFEKLIPLADLSLAPSAPAPADQESAPAPASTINTDAIKIEGPSWDRGAFHRAIEIARELAGAGMWDGQAEIWINAPYALHSAVFGIEHRPIASLRPGIDYKLSQSAAHEPAGQYTLFGGFEPIKPKSTPEPEAVQVEMFPAGDDLPLFSGCPMQIR